MDEIELIPAQPQDLDEICALCSDAAARTPSCGWNESYPNREILSWDLETGGLYKVMEEGRIISIMKIISWTEYMKGEEVESDGWSEDIKNPCALGRFCVSPALQGRGLGRRIMLASLKKAKSLGFDGARFHTVTVNQIAQHLYDKMGFRRVGMVHEFDLDFICYEIPIQA